MTKHAGKRIFILLGSAAALAAGCSSAPNGGGMGGNGGSTGAATCPTNATAKLSDFQMGTGIDSVDGRMGGWYFYGDPLGMYDPPKVDGVAPPADTTQGSPCSPAGSLRLKGTGFTGFGAGLGTNFVMPTGTVKNTYDASKYSGIIFYAKGATSIMHVQVKAVDWNTDPEVAAPKCMLTMNGDPKNCSPYLVKFDDLGKPITTEWKQFKVAFADMAQDQYNTGYIPTPAGVDKAHLTSFQIQINANFGASPPPTANNFEIWIDDVYFY
ncbi:MAG: hypothetical protein ABJA82_11230 [Myxococcales bacterium]